MSDYQVVLVNYANWRYHIARKLNTHSGLAVGGFDKVFAYGPRDIDSAFYRRNKKILQAEKGNGYWLWKPYCIKKALEKINYGDYLFYSDAGSYFIQSIHQLLVSPYLDQDLLVFELPHPEVQYTKRDAFVLMDCDADKYVRSKQMLASFSLWRKSDFTLAFVDDWLNFAQEERILTDDENTCGFENYPEFIAHRHDQSVFSLLSKKHGIVPYRDPTQFGNEVLDQYPNSAYGQILVHTRERNSWIDLNKGLQFLYAIWCKIRTTRTK